MSPPQADRMKMLLSNPPNDDQEQIELEGNYSVKVRLFVSECMIVSAATPDAIYGVQELAWESGEQRLRIGFGGREDIGIKYSDLVFVLLQNNYDRAWIRYKTEEGVVREFIVHLVRSDQEHEDKRVRLGHDFERVTKTRVAVGTDIFGRKEAMILSILLPGSPQNPTTPVDALSLETDIGALLSARNDLPGDADSINKPSTANAQIQGKTIIKARDSTGISAAPRTTALFYKTKDNSAVQVEVGDFVVRLREEADPPTRPISVRNDFDGPWRVVKIHASSLGLEMDDFPSDERSQQVWLDNFQQENWRQWNRMQSVYVELGGFPEKSKADRWVFVERLVPAFVATSMLAGPIYPATLAIAQSTGFRNLVKSSAPGAVGEGDVHLALVHVPTKRTSGKGYYVDFAVQIPLSSQEPGGNEIAFLRAKRLRRFTKDELTKEGLTAAAYAQDSWVERYKSDSEFVKQDVKIPVADYLARRVGWARDDDVWKYGENVLKELQDEFSEHNPLEAMGPGELERKLFHKDDVPRKSTRGRAVKVVKKKKRTDS